MNTLETFCAQNNIDPILAMNKLQDAMKCQNCDLKINPKPREPDAIYCDRCADELGCYVDGSPREKCERCKQNFSVQTFNGFRLCEVCLRTATFKSLGREYERD